MNLIIHFKEGLEMASIKTLERLITKHKRLYDKGTPEISDEEFDALEKQLRDVDPENPLLDRMAKPINKGDVKLPFALPSLNKIRPDAGIDWLDTWDGDFVVSDKLDGLAAEIVYEGGVPSQAFSSSDDGFTGKDISHLLPYMKIPAKINTRKRVVVRCELIISRANFNKHYSEAFKNARNLSSGVKNSTSGIHNVAKSGHFEAVGLGLLEPRLKPSDAFAKMKEWGFNTAPHKVVSNRLMTSAYLSKALEQRKNKSKYDIDGLVVEQDKKTAAPTANPKHQVAFKDKTLNDRAIVKVTKLTWEISRYGKLTPRVWFDPVRLEGSDVQKATGHNAKYIVDNKIGVGAEVEVIKSGSVIPKIEKVITRSRINPLKSITVPYEWNETGVDIFVTENDDDLASEQLAQELTHFFASLGIEGMKYGSIVRLINGGLDTVALIVKAKQTQFQTILGKNGLMIFKSLQDTKVNTCAPDWGYAWGGFGRGVGRKRLWAAWEHFGDEGMLDIARRPTAHKSEVVSLIGTVNGNAIVSNLKNFYTFLKSIGVTPATIEAEEIDVKSKVLLKQFVAFTGFRDTALEQRIVENSGEVTDGIRKETTILLVKDPNSGSSKVVKAKEKGINVMTVDTFLKQFKLK